MKKFLLLLCFFAISLSVSAQSVLKLKASAYSYQLKNNYGSWEDWSDWESSNVPIVMDMETDRVTIYSSEIQKYDIYEYLGEEELEEGLMISWLFIDQDGDQGKMRLLVRDSGRMELYIDFNNVRWAYIVATD